MCTRRRTTELNLPTLRSNRPLCRVSRLARLGATTALLLPLAAHAGDPPKFKEGLWEVHVISEEKPVGKKTDLTYRLCRDHAYDKAADAILKNLPGCTTVIKDVGGGKFSSASNCVVNGTTVVSTAMTTFTDKIASHSETTAKFIPPLNGKTDETMTQDQHYIGSCPSDLKPGDTISADGFIRHHN